ncbi:Ubiquitin-protein ligase [Geranomyces michiganensis]|nr:Ubiquitin-protein ligase [Geranomyces michiganensis]
MASEPATATPAAGAAIENIMWSTSMDVHAAPPPPAQTSQVPNAVAEQDEGGPEETSASDSAAKGGSDAPKQQPQPQPPAAPIANIMWGTSMDVHHDSPSAPAPVRPAAVGEEDESKETSAVAQTETKPVENDKDHDPAGAAAEVRRLDKESVKDAAEAKKAKEARDANKEQHKAAPSTKATPVAPIENIMWSTTMDVHHHPHAGGGGGGAKQNGKAAAAAGGPQKHRATVTHPIVKGKRNNHDRDVKIVVRLPTDTSTTLPAVQKEGDAGTAAAGATAADGDEEAISNIVQPTGEAGDHHRKKPTKREIAAAEAAEKLKVRKAAAAAAKKAAAEASAAERTKKAKRQQKESQGEDDDGAAAAAAEGASDSESRAARRRRRHPPPATAVDKSSYAHRHFQNLHPTTNKLVGVRWDAANRRIHAKRLNTVKSTIDTSAPKTYSHLEYKKKTLQLAMERQAQIDRDNDILLEKMASIMKMEQKLLEQTPTPMRFAHSLHASKRARDCAQIDKDNLAILHRLETRESYYPHADHLASRHQNLHYLTNIATYPTRFIHEEAVYDVLERTHVNTHDASLGHARRAEIIRDWTTPSAANYVPPVAGSTERVAAGGGAPHRHQLQEKHQQQQAVKGSTSHPRTPVGETNDEKPASKDQQGGKNGGEKTPPLLPRIPTPPKTEREAPAPAEPVVLPPMVAV